MTYGINGSRYCNYVNIDFVVVYSAVYFIKHIMIITELSRWVLEDTHISIGINERYILFVIVVSLDQRQELKSIPILHAYKLYM